MASPTPDLSRSASGDTTLARFLAGVLVANSHLEGVYPWRAAAGDGMIGASLFFAISGFSLVIAHQAHSRSFLPWLWRRAVRIYPTNLLYVVICLIGLGGMWRSWTPGDYFYYLIFPTPQGLIALLLAAYLFFYWLMRVGRSSAYLIAAGLATVLYGWFYVIQLRNMLPPDAFALGKLNPAIASTFYLIAMLLGGWMAMVPRLRVSRQPMLETLLLAGVFCVYVATKYCIVVRHEFLGGFGILQLLALVFILLFLRLGQSAPYRGLVERCGPLSRLIGWIAAASLELLLVHEYVINLPFVAAGRFPLNLFLFWVVSLSGAILLERVTGFLRNWLRPPSRRRTGAVKAEPAVAVAQSTTR